MPEFLAMATVVQLTFKLKMGARPLYAIEQAQLYLREQLVDMEAFGAEPKFVYWRGRRRT